jgi:hypothetical protein
LRRSAWLPRRRRTRRVNGARSSPSSSCRPSLSSALCDGEPKCVFVIDQDSP